MNTRGLTELIVLNIGLELGVISPTLFTVLVMMALVTTFITGPVLRLIDPGGVLAVQPEDELAAAATGAPTPERAILVGAQDSRHLDALLELAEPLARSQPARELVLARLLVPSRIATGPASDDHELTQVAADLHRLRERLRAAGLAVRTVAFTAADPAADLLRLAAEQPIDLILLDGRRPLLGEGVPRGPVGEVLLRAPCDVAVLVQRETGPIAVDPAPPGCWCRSGAPTTTGPRSNSAPRWPAPAGRRCGCWGRPPTTPAGATPAACSPTPRWSSSSWPASPAEPLLIEPGREGVLRAAEGAGLLVVGLSERWREEGLGATRAGVRQELSGGDPIRPPRRPARHPGPAGLGDPVRVVVDRARASGGYLGDGAFCRRLRGVTNKSVWTASLTPTSRSPATGSRLVWGAGAWARSIGRCS